MCNKPVVDPMKDPEAPLASQKTISVKVMTEFTEFEEQMKEQYGAKETAAVMNFFAQPREKRIECIKYELDYSLFGTTMFPIALSLFLVFVGLQLGGHTYPIIAFSSSFLQLIFLCCQIVVRKVFIRTFVDWTEDPEVALAKQKSNWSPDIDTEFAEFEAKMQYKYGEETTAATMKFFAQKEQERGKLYKKEFLYFDMAMNPTLLALTSFILYLLLRVHHGFDFPPLAYFSVFYQFVSLGHHGVNINRNRYSQLFSPLSLSIVILVIIIPFATHLSIFFFSWSGFHFFSWSAVVTDHTH